MKKVIMVGSNHAGTFTQFTLHQYYGKDVEVVTYDANSNTSFLGCGMALWVGGDIDKPEGLFYSSPEQLEEMGSKMHTEHEVIDVDFDKKEITVKDLKTGEEKKDNYDDIVFAVGSWPLMPPIEGHDLENIILAKRFQHAEKCMEVMKDKTITDVTVVGAGYIGIELAEAFNKQGKKTTLVTDGEILNKYYDKEFVQKMRERLNELGIIVKENEKVTKFEGENGKVTKVVTDKGTIDAQIVLMSVGVKANTKFLEGKGINLDERGVIITDLHQKTNIDHVYAVGDCSTMTNNANKKLQQIGLATNAVRSGIIAAHNIGGTAVAMSGVQGSNAIHIGGLTMASTGLTEEVAHDNGYDTDSVILTDNIRPEFMPTNCEVTIKVVWCTKDLRILGAQIMADEDISLAIHMFSLAIEQGYTIDKLATLDLFFLPHFNKPDNFITKAGLLALDKILKG